MTTEAPENQNHKHHENHFEYLSSQTPPSLSEKIRPLWVGVRKKILFLFCLEFCKKVTIHINIYFTKHLMIRVFIKFLEFSRRACNFPSRTVSEGSLEMLNHLTCETPPSLHRWMLGEIFSAEPGCRCMDLIHLLC